MEKKVKSQKEKVNPGLVMSVKAFLEIIDKATFMEEDFYEDVSEEIQRSGIKSLKSLYDENILQKLIMVLMRDRTVIDGVRLDN
jgi:DNA primase large subunit